MPDEQPTRTCRKCGETKPLDQFVSTKGKRWFQCKECCYKRSKQWQQAHKDRYSAAIKKWHEAHKERVTEIKRAYRSRNAKTEKSKARAKYWLDHAATRSARNATQRKFRKENPELQRSYLAKRRRQLKSVGANYTAKDVVALIKAQRNKCAEPTCGISLQHGYHVDHIMPLALGGTNAADNIQLLCPRCNIQKKSKHPLQWAKERGRLF